MDGPLAVGGPRRAEASRANVAAPGSIRPERTNVPIRLSVIMTRLNFSVMTRRNLLPGAADARDDEQDVISGLTTLRVSTSSRPPERSDPSSARPRALPQARRLRLDRRVPQFAPDRASGLEQAGSPARSATRRAEKTCPFSTPAPPDFFADLAIADGDVCCVRYAWGMTAICATRTAGVNVLRT